MIFNLTLDDFSPHLKAGLNFEVIDWCEQIIKMYPEFKVNLFVPAAYCRLGESPCFLTEHMDWINKVKQLNTKNYRINCHGYYHRRLSQKHGNSNNDEFQFLNEKEATIIIDHMIGEFKAAGLEYYPTFRPPGWKLSKDTAKVLTDKKFIIAGNEMYRRLYRNKVPNMKWVSYNWDLLTDVPKGDIIAYGHTSNWTTNYLNEDKYKLIMNVLGKEQYEFKFIEELL